MNLLQTFLPNVFGRPGNCGTVDCFPDYSHLIEK
jgi:hypothetical protein